MRQFLSFFIVSILLFSCKRETKETSIYRSVDSFLYYITNRDGKAIEKMAFPSNSPSINIADSFRRKFYVERTADIINEYGIPSKDRWILVKIPLCYEVHVPLFDTGKQGASKKEFELIIEYTPDQIGNQIFDFSLVDWRIQKQVNEGMKYERSLR